MANEICNDKSEGHSGTAGPKITRKKNHFYMYIPKKKFVYQKYDKC